YRQILSVAPGHFDATHLLGVALVQRRQVVAGEQLLAKALKLNPNDPSVLNNHGLALHELKRFDEALASYDRALAMRPDYADALSNRGLTLEELKRFEEALASYDKAIALKPDYAEAFNNRGHSRLLAGRFKEGWIDYEWRWETKGFLSKRPNIKAPTWQGEDLSRRHLLVFFEQGLGDIIQFVRYLPLLAERKCKITFFAPEKLARLLRPSIHPVEIVSTLNDVQGVDFQIALMSL